ncbi:hypothetical protein Tco_0585871, partial [Tanacetum coccineum]
MAGSEDDTPSPPPSQTPTQQTSHTVLTIKLPILKKGQYDIWAMKMEHYLALTDYLILGVIQREGNGPLSLSLMLKALLHHPLARRMWHLFLENTLAVLMIVSTAYGVSNSSGHNSQYEHPSSYSLLANQSSCPQLDHEDLEQLDEFDLEEMDLKWQVPLIFLENEKVLQKDRSKGNQDSRRRDAWNTRNKDKENRRRSGKQEDSKALVTLDEEGVDWTSHSEDEQENYALMACSSSGSDTEMSARDKAGLGYSDQLNKGVLSYENEVFQSVFVSRTSDIEDSPQSKPRSSESDARSSDFNTYESNCSEETHESMPEPVFNEPKVHVKTPRQTVKEQNTCSQSPKPDKKDCSGLMAEKMGLGYGFTKKACFVYGSFSYLIRDCDFHEKRMAKQAELNNRMSKGSGQREIRPVWNNVQRVNHQNQFVPKAVLTRTGKIQVNTTRTNGTNTFNTARTSGTNTVNTTRHNFNRQAVPTNVARKVNTVKPIVNNARPKGKLMLSPQIIHKELYRTKGLLIVDVP